MPISKDAVTNAIVTTPPNRGDLFAQTGVANNGNFAVCDKTDLVKQIKFDPANQTTNTTVTIASGASGSDTTITLPANTGTISTAAFKTMQTPAGTSPTATTPTSTLTLTSSNSTVVITGNSGTNTVDLTTSSGAGTVTSVTYTGDGVLQSSTPSAAVTTSGTLTAALKTQTANTVLAGPASGGAANPTFRTLGFSEVTGSVAAGQMPALTGDVTTSAGAVATTLATNIVTNAKAAQMAANTFKGNNTGSTANAVDMTAPQALSVLHPVTAAAKTGNYTLLTTDRVIKVNPSGAFNITMPAPTGAGANLIYTITNIASGTSVVTIQPSASETFGAGAYANLHLSTIGETWTLQSDGTNWVILSHLSNTPFAAYTMTVGAVTTAPTSATTHTMTTYWQRIGKNMCVQLFYTQSGAGGANGSGVYLYPLPTGYTIDTTALVANTNPLSTSMASSFGSGFDYANSDSMRAAAPQLYNSSNFYIMLSSSGAIGSGNHGWGATGSVQTSVVATFPVSGWEE